MGGVAKMIDHFDGLVFRGMYDAKKNYELGDLCIKDDSKTYLYTEVGWDCITSAPTSYEPSTQIKKITYPTNCKNCGAVLHNNICEYCNTDNKEERI